MNEVSGSAAPLAWTRCKVRSALLAEFACRELLNLPNVSARPVLRFFAPDRSVRISDVTDGADRTIFLIEVRDSGTNWLEPNDLPFTRVTLNGLTNHAHGTFAGFIDGSIRFLGQNRVNDAKLKALSTIAGGEVLDPSEF